MKIFQEFNYLKGVQKEFNSPFLLDLIYPLEDIILSPRDIIGAYIPKIENALSYPELSSIDIISIPKNREVNEGIFNRFAKYIEEEKELKGQDYDLNLTTVNTIVEIMIKILNRSPNYIQGIIVYSDGVYTTSENFEIIQDFNAYPDAILTTKKFPFRFKIRNLDYLRINDYVKFNFRYLLPKLVGGNLPDEFSFVFDNVNYNLYFSENLNPEYIQLGLYSFGSIIRPNSLNEFLRNNQNLPLLIDVNRSQLILPEDILIPEGRILYLIRRQYRNVLPSTIPAGFSFIAIYIDKATRQLLYEPLYFSNSYTDVKNSLTTILLEPDKKIYLAFAIVENLISRLRQYDIWYLNIGGSGSGAGASKFIYESCNRYFTIQYTTGQPPILQFYDTNGLQFQPQEVRYNEVANQIEIDIGTQICYKVVII